MKKPTTTPLIFLLFALWVSGCSTSQRPVNAYSSFGLGSSDNYHSVATRFKQPDPNGPAGLNPLQLSKKCDKLTKEIESVRQQKENLLHENNQLKKQNTSLRTNLQQTEKELNQANQLLRKMVIELNNWKVNVIGFRDEMREADKAQLEALLKILRILGGKTESETAQQTDADQPSTEPAASEKTGKQVEIEMENSAKAIKK